MKCEEFTSALDAYIDGELSADEVRAIRGHAEGCVACREELKRAEFLRDTLLHMDDHIAVPLEAQAAWRSAVKRERARKKRNVWIRPLVAAAAAAVVLVGGIAMIGNQKNDLRMNGAISESLQMISAEADGLQADAPADGGTRGSAPVRTAVIQCDGESADAANAVNEETDYACWKKLRVADLKAACAALDQLADEYEGSVTRESGAEKDVIYRVVLPGSNLNDFVTAVGSIGDVRDSEVRDGSCDPAIVYVQLFE